MREAKMPILHSTEENVIVTDGVLDLEQLQKEGWKTIEFYGFAHIRSFRTFFSRLFHTYRKIPMFKLTKVEVVE